MAIALDRLGRRSESTKYYESALELEPSNQDALRNLVISLFAQKKIEQALDRASAGSQLFPSDPAFWHVKGDALYALGHYAEASEALATAISLDPTDKRLWWSRGIAGV